MIDLKQLRFGKFSDSQPQVNSICFIMKTDSSEGTKTVGLFRYTYFINERKQKELGWVSYKGSQVYPICQTDEWAYVNPSDIEQEDSINYRKRVMEKTNFHE